MPRIVVQDAIYRDDDYIESANHRNSRHDSLTKYTNTIKSKIFDMFNSSTNNNFKSVAIDNKWTDEELAADSSRTAVDILTPAQAFSTVLKEADYKDFLNVLDGVQSIISKSDTNTLGVAAGSVAVRSPSDQTVLSDEENEVLEKASKSSALEMIEIFYQTYMSPIGTADISYRLGGVVGVVTDPKSIASIPGYTTAAGEIFTPSNLQFSFTRHEYSNADLKQIVDPTTEASTLASLLNNDTTARTESYANLLFPPYTTDDIEDASLGEMVGTDSYDTADFGDKTEVSATGYYGQKLDLDDLNNIRNKSYKTTVNVNDVRRNLEAFSTATLLSGRNGATYRAPGFKAVNDNINLLQTLLERTTGIVSTYITEWDLSLYMQEGIVNVNDDDTIDFVTKLNYRLIDDVPQISDDDIDKSGTATASAGSVSEKNYLKAVCFGTVNSAVSALRAGSYGPWNDLEYYPQLSPLSPWWVSPTGDAATQVWEATGAENSYENGSGDDTSGSQANTVQQAVDLTSGDVSAMAAPYEGEWTNGMPVFWATSGFFNYNNAYYNSGARSAGLVSSPNESKLCDIIEPATRTSEMKNIYDYANGGYLKSPADMFSPSVWLGLKPTQDPNSNILSKTTSQMLAQLDRRNAMLSGWTDLNLPMWKQFYTDDTDGLSDIDQAMQEVVTEQPYSLFDAAQTVLNEVDDSSINNAIDNTKNAAKVESGLQAASGTGTATPPSSSLMSGSDSNSDSDYKFKLFKCSLTIPGSSLLKMFLKRSSKTSKAMSAGNSSGGNSSNGNVLSDPVAATNAYKNSPGLGKKEVKVPQYDDNGNPVTKVMTYTDPVTGEVSLKEQQVYDTVVVQEQEGVGKQYSQPNGIATWSPFLYGGPHGRYRSPTTVQGYFEDDSIFMRNNFRYPLKNEMLPRNGHAFSPFEMHQKYMLFDQNLNNGVAKGLEAVGTGHSDNGNVNYAGMFYMAMKQTTGEMAVLSKGFRYFPQSDGDPNRAVPRYNFDLGKVIDNRRNLSYDGNYNISKAGGLQSLEDEDAGHRNRLTFTDVLQLKQNSTTVSYRKRQKEFVLATDYDSVFGYCVPLNSTFSVDDSSTRTTNGYYGMSISKPYDEGAQYLYRPNYVKTSHGKFIIPCDMCLYMYLTPQSATKLVNGTQIMIANDLSDLKTNNRMFKTADWNHRSTGEYTGVRLVGQNGDVHPFNESWWSALCKGNPYASAYYVPLMYMDIVNALFMMRFTDASQTDLRWWWAWYRRRSSRRRHYWQVYYTVTEGWHTQMFRDRGHWNTTWNGMALAHAVEQFYPGHRSYLESRNIWRLATPHYHGFFGSSPTTWSFVNGGSAFYSYQTEVRQVRYRYGRHRSYTVTTLTPQPSAYIRSVYTQLSDYINNRIGLMNLKNYSWIFRRWHWWHRYWMPRYIGNYQPEHVRAQKMFDRNIARYVTYSGSLSQIATEFNYAINRGRIYNDWSTFDTQIYGNRNMSNIIHHGYNWHVNYHSVRGIANLINGSSLTNYQSYMSDQSKLAEEHKPLSEAILKMISKATCESGMNNFYGLFYQKNGRPNYDALQIDYAQSRNSEDDSIKSYFNDQSKALGYSFIAPYNPSYGGKAHVKIPFGIAGVERPTNVYIPDVMSSLKNDKLFVFDPNATTFTRSNSLNYTIKPIALPDIVDAYDVKTVGAGKVNWAIMLAPNGWKETDGRPAGEVYNEVYDKVNSALANLDFTDNESVSSFNDAFANLKEANGGSDIATDGSVIFRLVINPRLENTRTTEWSKYFGKNVTKYSFTNNSALNQDIDTSVTRNFSVTVNSWNYNGKRWQPTSRSYVEVKCNGTVVARRHCPGRGTTLWRINPTDGSIDQIAYEDTYGNECDHKIRNALWSVDSNHIYALSIWDACTLEHSTHLMLNEHGCGIGSCWDSDRHSFAAVFTYNNQKSSQNNFEEFSGTQCQINGNWRTTAESTVSATWRYTFEADPWQDTSRKIEYLFMNNRDEVFWDVVGQHAYPMWNTVWGPVFHCWWWRGCHWRHRSYQWPHYRWGHQRSIVGYNYVDITKPKYVNYTQSIEELKLYNKIQKCCNKSANIYAPWTLGTTPMLYADFEDNSGHLFSMGIRALAPERYRVRQIHWVKHVRYEHAHYSRSYKSFDWHACAGWWWETHWVHWCGYDYPVYYYTYYYTYGTDYFRQIAVYPTTMRYCLTEIKDDQVFKYRTERQKIESANWTIEAQGNMHNNQVYPASTEAYVKVYKNGAEVARRYSDGRGFTLFAVNPKTGNITDLGHTDTYWADRSCNDICNLLKEKAQSSDQIYVLISYDAISMTDSLKNVLAGYGLSCDNVTSFQTQRQAYVAVFSTTDSEWSSQSASVESHLGQNGSVPTLNNNCKVKFKWTTSVGESTSDIVGTSASGANIEPFRKFMVDWTKTGTTNGQGAPYRARVMSQKINPWSKANPSVVDAAMVYNAGKVILYYTTENGCQVQHGYPDESNRVYVGQYVLTGQHLFFNEVFTEQNGKKPLDDWQIMKAAANAPQRLNSKCIYVDTDDTMVNHDYIGTLPDSFTKNFGSLDNWATPAPLPESTKKIILSNLLYGNTLIQPPTNSTDITSRNPMMMNSSYVGPLVSLLMTMQEQKAWIDKTAEVIKSSVTDHLINGIIDQNVDPMIVTAIEKFEGKATDKSAFYNSNGTWDEDMHFDVLIDIARKNFSDSNRRLGWTYENRYSYASTNSLYNSLMAMSSKIDAYIPQIKERIKMHGSSDKLSGATMFAEMMKTSDLLDTIRKDKDIFGQIYSGDTCIGSYADSYEMKMLSYLEVLYQYRKYFVNKRFNKQDGSYWALRALEKVLPSTSQILSTTSLKPVSSTSSASGTSSYAVVLMDISNSYVDKGNALISANSDTTENVTVLPQDCIDAVYVKVQYVQVPDGYTKLEDTPDFRTITADDAKDTSQTKDVTMIVDGAPETRTVQKWTEDDIGKTFYKDKEVVYIEAHGVSKKPRWAYKPVDGLYMLYSDEVKKALQAYEKTDFAKAFADTSNEATKAQARAIKQAAERVSGYTWNIEWSKLAVKSDNVAYPVYNDYTKVGRHKYGTPKRAYPKEYGIVFDLTLTVDIEKIQALGAKLMDSDAMAAVCAVKETVDCWWIKVPPALRILSTDESKNVMLTQVKSIDELSVATQSTAVAGALSNIVYPVQENSDALMTSIKTFCNSYFQ